MYSTPTPTRRPQFLYRGNWRDLDLSQPDRTLLDLVRRPAPAGLGATGTKEGCAQGDCGACAVLLAELAPATGALTLRAVNACIRLASSIEGCALWTVEDLQQLDGQLHPVQQALVEQHGSQCGFCTPGFVISLAAMYEQRRLQSEQGKKVYPLTRADVTHAISGNLCRCTGYRPIVDAGLSMNAQHPFAVTEVRASGLLAGQSAKLQEALQAYRRLPAEASNPRPRVRAAQAAGIQPRADRPTAMRQLLRLRAGYPDALVIAGTTDAGLWINKQHRRFDHTIDVTSVAALHRIRHSRDALRIGAAARLTEAFQAISDEWPQLEVFLSRFAGLTIRNSATLGGNIANGSPIGDSMPLLIAMGASLTLTSVRGERNLPIEDFFLGYRRTALAPDEILTAISIPRSRPHAGKTSAGSTDEFIRAYKLSKRFEDDISAVCLALRVTVDRQGNIVSARVGAGGVAAVPALARKTQAALAGQRWSAETLDQAGDVLAAEFQPISDMRASGGYRRAMLRALLNRFWSECNGTTVSLDTLSADELRGADEVRSDVDRSLDKTSLANR